MAVAILECSVKNSSTGLVLWPCTQLSNSSVHYLTTNNMVNSQTRWSWTSISKSLVSIIKNFYTHLITDCITSLNSCSVSNMLVWFRPSMSLTGTSWLYSIVPAWERGGVSDITMTIYKCIQACTLPKTIVWGGILLSPLLCNNCTTCSCKFSKFSKCIKCTFLIQHKIIRRWSVTSQVCEMFEKWLPWQKGVEHTHNSIVVQPQPRNTESWSCEKQ